MSSHAHAADSWDSHAGKWTQSTQQITQAPCLDLIERVVSLSPTDEAGVSFLDNGCGAGMVASLLKSRYPSVPVTATDVSAGMLDSAKSRAKKEGWEADFHQLDSQKLSSLKDGSFSHVFCTFVTSFTEDPAKATAEMYRVLRPGGAAGVATWSRVSWVPVWEDAARAVKGDEYVAPTLFHSRTMEVGTVKQDMKQAGFEDVDVTTFACYHPEKDVDAAVEEFYSMGNPSIKLLMKGLSPEAIEQTRPRFRAAYDKIYDGGRTRQYELAILATGQKSP